MIDDVIQANDLNDQINEVSYLSSEIGFVTTTSAWTEPEILLFLYIAGDIQNVRKGKNDSGYETLTYTLPRSSFSELIGRRLSTKQASEVFKTLESRSIYFKDEISNLNTRYTVFPQVDWSDDLTYVKLHIGAEAMGRFEKLSHYIPFALKHRISLKRANPIRLYILIKRDIYYFSEYKKYKTYSIKDLRGFFGCQNKYPRTGDFLTKVIKKSVESINKQADKGELDITVKHEIVYLGDKKGSRVTGVKFTAIKTKQYQNYILPAELEIHRENTSNELDVTAELLECLNKLNIPESVQKKAISKYGINNVMNAAYITRDACNMGDINKSAIGHFLGVLENKGVHNPKTIQYEELRKIIDEIKKFCSKNKDTLRTLIHEFKLFAPYLVNFRNREVLNELIDKMKDLSRQAEQCEFNIDGSRDLIMEGDEPIYLCHLIRLSQSELLSESIKSSIEQYQKIIKNETDHIKKQWLENEILIHEEDANLAL
tara:strand:- start:350 stop:1807 length:1458 start_codon:yes stop_codon:yes gene_type:complete